MKKIILFFVLISLFRLGNAQSMYINEQTASQRAILLSSISFLSFQNGNLIINEKSGAKQSVVLSNIKTLIFKTATSLIALDGEGFTAKVFPNPAADYLNIQLPKHNGNRIVIQILDLSGSVLYSTNSPKLSWENSYSISLNSLKAGLYLWRIIVDEKIYNHKFIKTNTL